MLVCLNQGFSTGGQLRGHGTLTAGGHERHDNVAIQKLFTVVPSFLFKSLSNLI